MRSRHTPDEALVLRLGAGLVGCVLLTAASLAASLAREHMIFLGTICGVGSHPHCGWCYGAAGLVLAGLAAFSVALRRPSQETAPCPPSASRP
jgi:hypothetical protein